MVLCRQLGDNVMVVVVQIQVQECDARLGQGLYARCTATNVTEARRRGAGGLCNHEKLVFSRQIGTSKRCALCALWCVVCAVCCVSVGGGAVRHEQQLGGTHHLRVARTTSPRWQIKQKGSKNKQRKPWLPVVPKTVFPRLFTSWGV